MVFTDSSSLVFGHSEKFAVFSPGQQKKVPGFSSMAKAESQAEWDTS